MTSIPVLPYQVRAAKLLILLGEKYGKPVTPKITLLARAGQSPRGDTPYVIESAPAAGMGSAPPPAAHSAESR